MNALPVIELLAKMVSFPSISGGEAPLVAWLAEYMEAVGLKPVVDGRNLYVVLEGSGPTILFNTHTDVVPVGEGWTGEPFTPRYANGCMYGRGANDAKGCGAAMLATVARLAGEKLRGSVVLALTCDEETGGDGLEKLIRKLPPADGAVVGEPTFNRPSLGMRGLVSAKLSAKGRGCHASRPHEGINPLYALARDMLAIEAFRPAEVDPILGAGTLAVTVIAGGSMDARNRVPDTAEAIIDMRTTGVWDNAKAVEDLRKLATCTAVEVRSARIRPKSTPADSRIAVAAFQASGGEAYEFRGASDFAYIPAPGVILGPGNTTSHQPDEHVPLAMVERAVDIYADIARRFLAG